MPGFRSRNAQMRQAGQATVIAMVVRWAGALALLAFVAAVIGFGLALPGYEQLRHPVALLGARGIPHAAVFNFCGFLLAGTLAATQAGGVLTLRPAGAPWSLRIGGQLLLLSGLAFAAMGIFPLDPVDLDDRASQAHATAWLLWVVAQVPAGLLLWRALRATVPGLAWTGFAVALLVALLSFGPVQLLPQALAQRLSFLAWLVWLAVIGWRWPRPVAGRG
jgi:hypothetical membrane protein